MSKTMKQLRRQDIDAMIKETHILKSHINKLEEQNQRLQKRIDQQHAAETKVEELEKQLQSYKAEMSRMENKLNVAANKERYQADTIEELSKYEAINAAHVANIHRLNMIIDAIVGYKMDAATQTLIKENGMKVGDYMLTLDR